MLKSYGTTNIFISSILRQQEYGGVYMKNILVFLAFLLVIMSHRRSHDARSLAIEP